MQPTGIEWVRNPDGSPGQSWNPLTGCFGPGGTPDNLRRCPYCYAHRLALGRLKTRYLSFGAVHVPHSPLSATEDPFAPCFRPTRLHEPMSVKKPSTIFVCSMGEIFSSFYPSEWLKQILYVVKKCPQHRFLFLTKSSFSRFKLVFPDNAWCGVTFTRTDDWRRLLFLNFKLVSQRKFVSFEPLLEYLLLGSENLQNIDWFIIGAQTKPYNPPKIDWVDHIIDKANRSGIPVFLKDNLKPLLGENLRQEFPKDLMRR